MLGLPRRASATGALTALHWLRVRERIRFKALCICHRIINRRGPTYLFELLTPYTPIRKLRSSDTGQLRVPRVKRARMGGRSFRYLAARYWNELPLSLRLEPSETLFRKQLKTLLFSSY